MQTTRRDFLKFCQMSSAALGLGAADLGQLENALASPTAPTVLWLQGSSCTGCSISFLNRVSSTAPTSAADALIHVINLAYHPNLMALAGESAAQVAIDAKNRGGYILAVEGGVPTAFGGNACWAWNYQGQDVTFQQAVTDLAARASQILCVGTCASFGGVAAAPPNPAGIRSVFAVTLKKTVNIAGCPPHPDWIVWAIAKMIANSVGGLDSYGRPTALYSRTVHGQCPRREQDDGGGYGIDHRCLEEWGCKGPSTAGGCPTSGWNNGANYCTDANSLCIGCTNSNFGAAQIRRLNNAHSD